jgi:predicted peroxiredoxin
VRASRMGRPSRSPQHLSGLQSYQYRLDARAGRGEIAFVNAGMTGGSGARLVRSGAAVSPTERLTTIGEPNMSRRNALTQLAALPLMVAAGASVAAETKLPLKIMMKSAWGSDDPTKAAFPFLHGHALAEAGHTVQIFLLGEAVSLMRLSLTKAVVPVGWPPLEETLQKVVARKIQIFACGACSRARGVTDADLAQWGAKFGNPTIFVSLVEWADRIITE